ncbi:MAG: S8 family serine peptidase [Anaerolineales bacterium]
MSTSVFLQVNPVFQTDDAEMAITDEFIATFPLERNMEEINAINTSHGVELVEPILGQENTYILRVSASTRLDVLAMANLYQESGVATYAAPDFVRIKAENQTKPAVGPLAGTDDGYYPDQWYLNNTQQYGPWMTADADIDAPEAWDYSTGNSTIIIAVIDEGVDLSHEDFRTKLVPGYDATGLGSGGGPSGNDAHGTNAAGLAAASSNNILGMAGVCQYCRIMPVRIAYDSGGSWITNDSKLANGITWAYQHGASILNNSWGGGSPATVVNTAISNAKTLGRAGKGAVVVFSAGNDNASTVSYPASLSTVIAVGASNMCDQRKTPTDDSCNAHETNWGSNYGSALDISAPGVWLDSTDIMGAPGYSNSNYYLYFNGTSGAAPIVSGVAGLILSINPNLTATQVQTILQNTADDVNGGGWDSTMGYGRVNADRAVRAAGTTTTTIKIGAAVQGNYNLLPNQSTRASYAVNNGPVQVKSSGGVPSMASERVAYSPNGGTTWTSYSEIMGLPAGQATTSYYFPWYNNIDLNTQLRFANVGSACTTVTIKIGGVVRGNYNLCPNQSTRASFNINSGPVQVMSSGNVKIIASERVAYSPNGGTTWTSFSEIMGLPADQATNSYYFPWYNNIDLNTQLRFANVGSACTTVTVKIGGVVRGNYNLCPNQSTRASFNIDSGPVQVMSSGNVKIIASERVAYFNGSAWTDFSEVGGLPAGQLTDTYLFPWYNNIDLDTQVRFANVGPSGTTVTVMVGGVIQGSYYLNPNQSTRASFSVNNGPVRILSSGGAKIIASERVAYWNGSAWTSFSEMMGLPLTQLSDTYYFPWYNNIDLNSQIRFGVP